ncbi:hypothetical protein GCM10009646_71900 [Streptomyces aureus]
MSSFRGTPWWVKTPLLMPPAHTCHRPLTSPIRVNTHSNRTPEGVDESALTANALREAVTGQPGARLEQNAPAARV